MLPHIAIKTWSIRFLSNEAQKRAINWDRFNKFDWWVGFVLRVGIGESDSDTGYYRVIRFKIVDKRLSVALAPRNHSHKLNGMEWCTENGKWPLLDEPENALVFYIAHPIWPKSEISWLRFRVGLDCSGRKAGCTGKSEKAKNQI